jgi:hypothetical protein
VEHRFDFQERGVAAIETSGDASLDGFTSMIRAFAAHPELGAGDAIVVDHSALEFEGLSGDDVRQVAQLTVQVAEALYARGMVIVAPGDAAFGLSRMWQSIAADVPFPTAIVRTREAAHAWISELPREP